MNKKIYDYIDLDLTIHSELNEDKFEEIGNNYNEFVANLNEVWDACYQGYEHIEGNVYRFKYLLKRVE